MESLSQTEPRPTSTSTSPNAKELLNANYVDESHVEAFAHALQAEFFIEHDYIDTPRASTASLASGPLPGSPVNSPLSPPPYSYQHGHSSTGPRTPRIRKITALSDFAPVNLKVKKRKKGAKHHTHDRRQDWLFVIVRWPLLCLIFLFILFEFWMYVFVRQCVNAKEWFTAWSGRKGLLRKKLRATTTYDEWKETALALDEYLGFDEWKRVDDDPFYDWRLVRKVLKSLRTLRKNDDARGVLGVLETCLRTNFAGVESARLYSETFFGTKDLVESYVSEVETAMIYLRESPVLSNEEKRRFFKSANMNLGISALCLSGGATFGYYHFGVLKAFVDADLLPRVITGTSAGGLVAALAGTRTDAELKVMLVPELADRITACEEPFRVWFKRFRESGARFDSVDWARKATFFTMGSLTFKEAYQRSGRILNVSVIPADRHSPTKLLNYLTAPDTVIWSALIASAAVPGILNAAVLMEKAKDGKLIPWNWGSKFKDGSLRVDIPLQSLNHYFNVTHPVVSQVNPHVHLFFFAPRGSAGRPVAHRKGKGWRGNFLLSAAEQWLKLELTKNFKVIRDLDLLPQLLGQDWSSVFLQRFDGSVTIWPKTRFMDWINILSDPSRTEMERMLRVGQLVTWPKLHMIENRLRLEREIFKGRRTVRRLLMSSTREPVIANDVDGGHVPDLSMGPGLTPGFELNGSSWPMDTDVEFPIRIAGRTGRLHLPASGSTRFDNPGINSSGTTTPLDLQGSSDPLRSVSRRRAWTSKLLNGSGSGEPSRPEENGVGAANEDHRRATPDPLPPDEPEAMTSAMSPSKQRFINFPHIPTGMFRTMRSGALNRLAHPFSSGVRNEGGDDGALNVAESAWSSDSSELTDDLNVAAEDSRDPEDPSVDPIMSSSREVSPVRHAGESTSP